MAARDICRTTADNDQKWIAAMECWTVEVIAGLIAQARSAFGCSGEAWPAVWGCHVTRTSSGKIAIDYQC